MFFRDLAMMPRKASPACRPSIHRVRALSGECGLNLRLSLYELAARHRLDGGASMRLLELAALDREPAALRLHAARGVAVLAAALGGFGLILWVAANWAVFGRFGRFGLLIAAVAVLGLGAALRPRQRAPLALLAFLATGGLFAYFGQTYQTGADPWQLFALWAVLGLPLAFGVRSDVLWAPWALVAGTALSLWLHAYNGHGGWRGGAVGVQLLSWLLWLTLVVALSAPLRRWTGAGPWSARLAVSLATAAITAAALVGLFDGTPMLYLLALVVFGAAVVLFATPWAFDVYAVSALGLGLNVLLVCGLARLLFEGSSELGGLLVLGIAAALLLAATVAGILALIRRQDAGVSGAVAGRGVQ